MGFKIIEVKLPTNYTEAELRRTLEKEVHTTDFTWQIETKSLDARKKKHSLAAARSCAFTQYKRGRGSGTAQANNSL